MKYGKERKYKADIKPSNWWTLRSRAPHDRQPSFVMEKLERKGKQHGYVFHAEIDYGIHRQLTMAPLRGHSIC